MIPLQNKGLEEMAVLFFLAEENTAKAFKAHLDSVDSSVTIQGIYKALNKLTAEDVLVKNKKKFVVSREWTQNLIATLGGETKMIEMTEGESVTYQFNMVDQMDAYWKHVINSIGGEFADFPVFSYEPHEIWVYLNDREESQENYLQSFEKEKRPGFFRLGGTTFGDLEYKKRFGNDYLQIDTNDKRVLDGYIIVIGDYFIVTKLVKDTMEKIDVIFATKDNPAEIKLELNKILNKKQRIKMSLERNREKAKRLRKKISENFYVPQDLIKKYDLF